MYQREVDVDMLNAVKSLLADVSSVGLCSDEGLTLETSANTLFMAFSISTSTLHWYIVRFTTTPTQTKTSSHRDKYSIILSKTLSSQGQNPFTVSKQRDRNKV